MRISGMNWLTLAILALLCIVAAIYYPMLPDPVPTHWNEHGVVDGWMPKPWGVWLIPAILVPLSAVLFVLPAISPRGWRLDSARWAYDLVVLAIVVFVAIVAVMSWEAAMGREVTLERALPWLLGLLFVVLGNYLPKFPKNFFIGIRTPWTLASDLVWTRTHRLAGWLFILMGLVLMLSGWLGAPVKAHVAIIVVLALVPVIYSLALYRKLHGFGPDD